MKYNLCGISHNAVMVTNIIPNTERNANKLALVHE